MKTDKQVKHNTDAIRKLNDDLRQNLNGTVMLTEGFRSLPNLFQHAALIELKRFNDFTPDNDPHGEHDFGAIEFRHLFKIFWKIEYYALDMQHGSEDPANPEITKRVLTVMLASEY